VFVSLEVDTNTGRRQIEFVFSETAARLLAQAVTAGSVGVVQQFDLSADGG